MIIKASSIIKLNLFNGDALERFIEITFLAIVVGLTCFYRWSFVIYPLPLNPDEVQAGANVLRLINYGLSWDSLDGTTVGPLNALILAWPFLLGWDVTLSTIRLTALIILCLVLCATYISLRLIGGKLLSMTLLLFLVAFYALNRNPEFQHYSSELLPVLLLSLSVLLLLYGFYGDGVNSSRKEVSVVPIGMLLGAAPFAKVQAAPIAITTSLFALYFILKSNSRFPKKKLIFLYVLSGLFPAVVILAPLAIKGEFIHFWNSYIIWPTLYVKDPLTISQFFSLILTERLLSFILALPFFALVLVAIFHSDIGRKSNRFAWGLFLLALMFSSWFSIVRPGNMFPHYLMFLPTSLLLLASFILNAVKPPVEFFTAYRLSYLGLFLFFLYSLIPKFEAINIGARNNFKIESPRIFDYLGVGPGDSLLIWGWMPQWYINSGLVPATRESMNNNQIVSSKLQDYFRDRLLGDLNASMPALVVDAVAGKSFGFNVESAQGLYSWDELSGFVESNYQRIHGHYVNSNCARTYVRNDLFYALKTDLVKFESVNASSSWSQEYGPQNVDDFSVTEDSCSDFWMLPNNEAGYLNIKFKNIEPIKRVLILNTANSGFMNHGSSKIVVTFYHEERVIKELEVKVKPYPQWTKIFLNEPVISDSVRLSVIDWHGNGGGINEVKLFR